MAAGDIDRSLGVKGNFYQSSTNSGTFNEGSHVYVSPMKFKISVNGLRPTTLHKFYLIDKDVTSDCIPLSGISIEQTQSYLNEFYQKGIYDSTDLTRIKSNYSFDGSLITDPYGKIEFYYFFNPLNSPYESKQLNNSRYITTYTSQQGIYAKIPMQNQHIYIRSNDGFSKASSIIEVK